MFDAFYFEFPSQTQAEQAPEIVQKNRFFQMGAFASILGVDPDDGIQNPQVLKITFLTPPNQGELDYVARQVGAARVTKNYQVLWSKPP